MRIFAHCTYARCDWKVNQAGATMGDKPKQSPANVRFATIRALGAHVNPSRGQYADADNQHFVDMQANLKVPAEQPQETE